MYEADYRDGSSIDIFVAVGHFSSEFERRAVEKFATWFGIMPELMREGMIDLNLVRCFNRDGSADCVLYRSGGGVDYHALYGGSSVTVNINAFFNGDDFTTYELAGGGVELVPDGTRFQALEGSLRLLTLHELSHHVDWEYGVSSTAEWAAAIAADGSHVHHGLDGAYGYDYGHDFVGAFMNWIYYRYPPGGTEFMCSDRRAYIESRIGNRLRYLEDNLDHQGKMCPLVPSDC